ncbi:DNA mismatch repair protein MutT [[Bacillus] sp. KCTC 13219]|nr:DNA mismatch repair protein MutT [[Bacillus] sp. KCTC 13219]
MGKVILTNMCMIYNKKNHNVLVQNRIKSWKGVAFPGGHVEEGESLIESTIREIKEETGLIITNLEPCGVIHWHNDEIGERYLVFNYRTCDFSGELLAETHEGNVFWVHRDDLLQLHFAEGMEERLPMFLEKKYAEGWYEKGEVKWF